MVTAEIATVLPVLVVLILAAVWAVGLAAAQLRCADAAREAARAAARGEVLAVVREVAEEVAPDGAQVSVERAEGMVVVEVRADVPVPLPLGRSIAAPTVRARAVALGEEP